MAKIIQPCLTLCDPMDYIVHGNLQARILEWIAFPSPGDLPNPGIRPRSPALQADSLPVEAPGKKGDILVNKIFLFSPICLKTKPSSISLHSIQLCIQSLENSEGNRATPKHSPIIFSVTVTRKSSQLFLINSQKIQVEKGKS